MKELTSLILYTSLIFYLKTAGVQSPQSNPWGGYRNGTFACGGWIIRQYLFPTDIFKTYNI